jgi:hypothetical protein
LLPTISWQYLVVLGQFGGLFMHFIYVDLSLFGWLDLHLECFEHFMQLIGVVSSLNLIIYFHLEDDGIVEVIISPGSN